MKLNKFAICGGVYWQLNFCNSANKTRKNASQVHKVATHKERRRKAPKKPVNFDLQPASLPAVNWQKRGRNAESPNERTGAMSHSEVVASAMLPGRCGNNNFLKYSSTDQFMREQQESNLPIDSSQQNYHN
eukprot:1157662-Pelagomonas_calceolata.AAC.5